MPAAASPDPSFDIPQYPTLALRHLRLARHALTHSGNGRRFDLFMARSAIFHATRMICTGPGQSVLVPAYICRTAVDPITAAGGIRRVLWCKQALRDRF